MECAICTNTFFEKCITECEANPYIKEHCKAVFGKCGHTYHKHCMDRWLKKHPVCPLDDGKWEEYDPIDDVILTSHIKNKNMFPKDFPEDIQDIIFKMLLNPIWLQLVGCSS